jgi:DNA repair photolyase
VIDAYYGELLVSCVPIELSIHYCSHKCAYCFANLGSPDRKADVKRIYRLLQGYQERHTVVAMLLQQGYPVLVSNRVDPFAASNYKVALPLLETLTAMGIAVCIQTKGGLGIDDALSFLPPSVWYISIAYEDDARRAAIEPGAPSLDERYELIETLVQHGHKVVVGLNPLVREWLPDAVPTLNRLKAAGVSGVWIERLHFNRKQSGNLTERERAAMGHDVVERAHQKINKHDFAYFEVVRQQALDAGLEIFSKNQPNASAFFQPYHEAYERVFPTLQDWINLLHTTCDGITRVTFDDFLAFFGPQFPAGVHGIDSYLGATAHNLWHTHKVPTQMTYSQLLALIWQEPRIKVNPANSPAFAFASADGIALQDERGLPILAFVPQGTREWWVDLELVEG